MKLSRSLVISALALILLLVSSVLSQTNNDFTPQFDPKLDIKPAAGKIIIDGFINDEGWQSAARATNFSEVSPGDQIKPPVQSEAWMTYDKENLYVALIAKDDPSTVRVSMRDRDNIFQDDYFGVMIDTYGDFAWGYEIFVNPLGIQGDLRMVNSGNEDMSFDIVFESKGMVTDSGYQVELAIPFSSLRFPDKKVQIWRVNFWRDHQRDVRRRYAWAAQDRNDPCFICQWGTVSGIKNIKPSSNIDFLPNIVAMQSSSREDPFDPIDNQDPDADISLNARYGLTSNSSIELTYNPDFSQVESDVAQIDINTTFGLFFPERRPFFQEGSDLFDTYTNVAYTRSINDPQVAMKFTGQFNRTSVAYLLARDETSPVVIPLEERSIQTLAGKSTSNILRMRQTFLRDSFFGIMITDRRMDNFSVDGNKQEGGSGTIYGVDGRLKFTQNLGIKWQILGSNIVESVAPDLIDTTEEDGYGQVYFDRDRKTVALDGEEFSGHSIYSNIGYNSRYYRFDIDYRESSPTFRADNGFFNRNGRRELFFIQNLGFQPNNDIIIEWGPGMHMGRVWNHDGKFRDEWINGWVNVKFRGETDIKVEYMKSRERFHDLLFDDISQFSMRVSNRYTDKINGGFNFGIGRRIYRGTPEMADSKSYGFYLNIKPTQRLYIQPNFDFQKMNSRKDNAELFAGYILRTKFSYQFTREWFIRLVVQYNDFSERVDIEPLLTYKLNPFTVFYVGMTNRTQNYKPENYDTLVDSTWKTSSRQFFAKLQYLFRI